VRTAVLIPVLAAGLAGAAATADGGGALSDTRWQVTGVGAFEIEPADGVTIESAEGRIAGRSGCNRYTGLVTFGAESLEIGAVGVTRMACPGRPAEIERSFLGALEQVSGWRIAGDGALELTAEGAPLTRAVAP
jgi:heat shock protein HslJ